MTYEEAYDELRRSGLRMTSLRKQVVRLFLDGGCGLSARDVLDSAGGSCHISTIHRCLNSLVGAGFLRPERNSAGVFRYRCSQRFYPDHGHFRCTRCGVRVPLHVHLPVEFIRSVERMGRFRIGSTDFFLEGTCRRCLKS